MSNYKLEQILLVESNFKLANNFRLVAQDEMTQEEYIKVEISKDDSHLFIFVNIDLSLSTKEDNRPILRAFAKMVGVFKPSDWNDPNLDSFSKINAPAIIFPYIREHISNLTLRVHIPIYLNPVNFIKLAENNNNTNEQK
jgi:preprotein translocase subunit SecB